MAKPRGRGRGTHSPRNFYKLIPLLVFFCNLFCNFCGNSLRHRFFFVTPMRSSGSRVDIAQKPNKSGQILDQRWKTFFVIFTKLIPRRIFFCIANILVLMVFPWAELPPSGPREYHDPPPSTAGIRRPPAPPTPPNLCPNLGGGGGRGIPVALGNICPWEYYDPGPCSLFSRPPSSLLSLEPLGVTL